MLYLANPPVQGTKPIAFLKNQNIIAGPTRMQDVLARGIPHHEQVAYGAYINVLPAFLQATAMQQRILASPESYFPIPMQMQLRELPFGLPPISVAPAAKKLTKEEFLKWQSGITGLQEVPHGKSTAYIVSTTDRNFLRSLFDTCNPAAQCPEGSMSLASAGSYFTVTKILLAFLATHTYPAFQAPAGSEDVQFSYAEDVQFMYKAQGKVVQHDRLEKRGLDCLKEAMERPTNRQRKIAAETHPTTNYALFENGEEAKMQGFVGEAKDGIAPAYTYDNAVNIAKPAPLRPEINYGPARSLPNLSGIACPYFEGMVLQDVMTIPQIIARYFFRNLGSTHHEASVALQAIKSGYMIWGKTRQGREMAHVFRCLALAIEAQARLYVCVDSEAYTGCSILGEQFSISYQGNLYQVESRVEQFSHFVKVNSHASAIADILTIIYDCKLREGEEELPKDVNVETFRQLWDLTKRVVQPQAKKATPATGEDHAMADEEDIGKEQAQKIRDSFKNLVFNERFIKCNPDNFAKALLDVKNGIYPLVADSPMHLQSPDDLFRRDCTFAVLSQFGPLAPSVINRGGTIIEIPHIVDIITKSDEVTTITKAPQRSYPHDVILISQKSLEAAVDDMNEMIKRKIIMQNPKERARGARNIAYEGATLTHLWDRICWACKGEAGTVVPSTTRVISVDEALRKAEKEKEARVMVLQDF